MPFALPGEAESLWEAVDADLFAQALRWAATSEAAAGETFNFTNGDMFVLRHAWPELATALQLDCNGHAPASFAAFFAEPESRSAWRAIAERDNLLLGDLDALLGQSHHYLDILTSARIAGKAVPMVVSTIRIRQAGFGQCIDSLISLRRQLAAMANLRLLPRSCNPGASL
jgi:hypothetical protein